MSTSVAAPMSAFGGGADIGGKTAIQPLSTLGLKKPRQVRHLNAQNLKNENQPVASVVFLYSANAF